MLFILSLWIDLIIDLLYKVLRDLMCLLPEGMLSLTWLCTLCFKDTRCVHKWLLDRLMVVDDVRQSQEYKYFCAICSGMSVYYCKLVHSGWIRQRLRTPLCYSAIRVQVPVTELGWMREAEWRLGELKWRWGSEVGWMDVCSNLWA